MKQAVITRTGMPEGFQAVAPHSVMTHYLLSDDLNASQMAAAEALGRLLNRGLCHEKNHSLWPAVGRSPEAIEKRSKMYKQNIELFWFRLDGSLSDEEEVLRQSLIAELGDKVLAMKSANFMPVIDLVRLEIMDICNGHDDEKFQMAYGSLAYLMDNIEEDCFFQTEMHFEHETTEQLLKILGYFQTSTDWREDLLYALQYNLAHSYWMCSAHLKECYGRTKSMPLWLPFREEEIAEAIDALAEFALQNREFTVIC